MFTRDSRFAEILFTFSMRIDLELASGEEITENSQVCWFIRGYPHAAELSRKRAVYRTRFIANVGKSKKEISKIRKKLEEALVSANHHHARPRGVSGDLRIIKGEISPASPARERRKNAGRENRDASVERAEFLTRCAEYKTKHAAMKFPSTVVLLISARTGGNLKILRIYVSNFSPHVRSRDRRSRERM